MEARKAVGIIRAYAERKPTFGELLKHRFDADIRPCQVNSGPGIMLMEFGNGVIEILRRPPGLRKTARDQCGDAIADETSNRLNVNGGRRRSSSMRFAAACKSGALSIRVPSRSKTTAFIQLHSTNSAAEVDRLLLMLETSLISEGLRCGATRPTETW